MSTERRRAPRAAERIPLAITGAEATIQAETKNLSASGAYVTLDRFLAPMTKVQLQLELPTTPNSIPRRGATTSGEKAPCSGSSRASETSRGTTSIRCAGVVVRVDPIITQAEQGRYHIAVFFTDLSDRDRSAIARFVSQRLSANRSTP